MVSKRLQMATAVVFFAAAVCLASAAEYQWVRNTDGDSQWAGRRLVGHVIATYEQVFVVTQCAQRCHTVADCASFNFLSALRMCEVNSASHVTNMADLVDADQSTYCLRDAFTIDMVTPPCCVAEWQTFMAIGYCVIGVFNKFIKVTFV